MPPRHQTQNMERCQGDKHMQKDTAPTQRSHVRPASPAFHKHIVDRSLPLQRHPDRASTALSHLQHSRAATKRLKLGERPEEYGAGSRSMRITIRYPTFSPLFGGKHVTQNVLLTRPQRREQRPLDRGSPSSLPNRIRTVTPVQAYELSLSRSSLRNLEMCGTEMRKPPGVSPFVLSANPGAPPVTILDRTCF